jgi:exopolysaccharide biosynthesis polyprenyl glycosylphosphotransferase
LDGGAIDTVEPQISEVASSAPEISSESRALRQARGASRLWLAQYRAWAVIGDLTVSSFAALTLYLVRFGSGELRQTWPLLLVPALWILALMVVQTYRAQFLGSGSEEYRAIGRAAVLVGCAVALYSYVGDLQLPRGLVLPLVPAVLVASLIVHWQLRRNLVGRRKAGSCLLNTVAVGRADSVAAMIREIESAPESGMRIVGACVSGLGFGDGHQDRIEGVPIFGPPESALAAVDSLGAEVVAVSSHPDLAGQPLRRLGWALAEREVDLVVAPGIVEVAGPRLSLRPAAGLSLLHVERPISSGGRILIKRAVDTIMTLSISLLLLPVFLFIAALVKTTSTGPAFFLQERVGARGERFQMIKFRTMVVDAEQLRPTIQSGHDKNAVLFKDPVDPRITKVGYVLRKYSLDELPQLFNVLLGDMSLVGPRPPLPREVANYEPDAVQRLRVRPGMTGLWQISGRSDLSWEQSLRLDLWYVDNWSPVLDLQILVRTVKAVVRGKGAY